MSYSFSIDASSKEAAKQHIARELAQVILNQPTHAADCHLHQAAAYAMIDALHKDGAIIGSMNGSVSTRLGDHGGAIICSLSMGINIGLA
jgi:hypothetical protein